MLPTAKVVCSEHRFFPSLKSVARTDSQLLIIRAFCPSVFTRNKPPESKCFAPQNINYLKNALIIFKEKKKKNRKEICFLRDTPCNKERRKSAHEIVSLFLGGILMFYLVPISFISFISYFHAVVVLFCKSVYREIW